MRERRQSRSPVANYLHNHALRLERQTAPWGMGLQLPVDEDGMIADQRLLAQYRMGATDSAACGCGWIACYNALRLLGERPRPESVLKALERDLVLRGRMGTRTVALPAFFLKRGYRVAVSFTLAGAEKRAPAADANIVYYLRSKHPSAHFVAFSGKVAENSEGEAVYRFYNSLTARLLPRRRPDGVEPPCYCAGGHRGDRRTLAALLEPEAPLLKAVFSISRPGGQAGRAGEN